MKLPNFVEIGGGDATTWRTTGPTFLDLDTIVLPGEVKQSVAEIRDLAALVDSESLDRDVSMQLDISRLPKKFARIRDNASADQG